jgi:hypothetical protein
MVDEFGAKLSCKCCLLEKQAGAEGSHRIVSASFSSAASASDMLQDCDALESEEKVVARGRPASEAG